MSADRRTPLARLQAPPRCSVLAPERHPYPDTGVPRRCADVLPPSVADVGAQPAERPVPLETPPSAETGFPMDPARIGSPAIVASERAMAIEIGRLPASACLLESAGHQVFCAKAAQIPFTLLEIGRLREVTYRTVGEGTGRERDLDAFDRHYLHLFSWNAERREIVGAYRIGRTDRIVADRGVGGLYTRTLFRYDERLVAHLAPALELGRSFVRAEYQRNHNALLLLWRGIGQFVVRHPHYRTLFGAVSISPRYSDLSKHLLMMFLEQNHLDREAAELVEAVNAPVRDETPPPGVSTSKEVQRAGRTAVGTDGKEMPVLLRQYLKLNARLLGFNVDPAFGGALDALMTVDLTAVEPAILRRYFGADAAAVYLASHRTVHAAA